MMDEEGEVDQTRRTISDDSEGLMRTVHPRMLSTSSSTSGSSASAVSPLSSDAVSSESNNAKSKVEY